MAKVVFIYDDIKHRVLRVLNHAMETHLLESLPKFPLLTHDKITGLRALLTPALPCYDHRQTQPLPEPASYARTTSQSHENGRDTSLKYQVVSE